MKFAFFCTCLKVFQYISTVLAMKIFARLITFPMEFKEIVCDKDEDEWPYLVDHLYYLSGVWKGTSKNLKFLKTVGFIKYGKPINKNKLLAGFSFPKTYIGKWMENICPYHECRAERIILQRFREKHRQIPPRVNVKTNRFQIKRMTLYVLCFLWQLSRVKSMFTITWYVDHLFYLSFLDMILCPNLHRRVFCCTTKFERL